MRKTVWAALIATAFSTPSFAVTVDTDVAPYIGSAFGYEISDNDRNAKNGYGVQVTFGVPLSYAHGAIELTYWDVRRDRALDGALDLQTSLMVNYVQDFGSYWFMKPYALVGIGGLQEDVLGAKSTHAAFDAGVGTLFALPWRNLAVRTEARALGQDNNRSSAPGNEDFVMDYRVLVGLQMPLMMAAAPAAVPATPKAAGCDVKVVGADGRSDCGSDSDHDGVPDGIDQCPGTPPGVTVNEVGCPAVAGADAVKTELPAPTAIAPKVAEDGIRGKLNYVTFSDNKFTIDGESKDRLDQVVALLANDPDSRVEIEGRTDNRGSEAYNIVLGSKRAEAVRQYLLGKGVNPARLSAISLGEFHPISSNKTAAGRKENRSVRFHIVKNK